MISLAVCAFLTGAAFAVPTVVSWGFFLSLAGGSYVRVNEVLVPVCFLIASLIFMGVLYWIWSRPLGRRGFLLAAAMTVGIWLVTLALFALIVGIFMVRGDFEFLILATMFFASAATLVLWVQTWRYYGGKPLFATDGQINVKCPDCGYNMAGLKETRCPECGQQYTIDVLIAKQNYETKLPTIQRQDVT